MKLKDLDVGAIACGGILLCVAVATVAGLYAMSLSMIVTNEIEDYCFANTKTLVEYNECTETAQFLYEKELRKGEDYE